MSDTASERTIPTGEGLTFEKVWEMFQEHKKEMREMSLEADRRKEEIDRQMKESSQKADRQLEKTSRLISRIDKQIGGLHNSFGELAEHLVAPGIANRFNELGYRFDAASPGGYKIFTEKGKTITEIDLLMENASFIMAVEIKTKPKIQDIDHHLKRLEILREHRLKHGDKRKIRGAIAGAVFGSEEKKAVLEAGLYAIEQSGDTMKIEIPDGFVPREW